MQRIRGSNKDVKSDSNLSPSALKHRRAFSDSVFTSVRHSKPYQRLADRNAFVRNTTLKDMPDYPLPSDEQEEDHMLQAYPLNASGYYRGNWRR